jgi:hypothetical protein
MVVSPTPSTTVKVTTPLVPEEPLAAEIVELPPLFAKVTVIPETGLPLASLRVTVIVVLVTASAAKDVALVLTVDRLAETLAWAIRAVAIIANATRQKMPVLAVMHHPSSLAKESE